MCSCCFFTLYQEDQEKKNNNNLFGDAAEEGISSFFNTESQLAHALTALQEVCPSGCPSPFKKIIPRDP